MSEDDLTKEFYEFLGGEFREEEAEYLRIEDRRYNAEKRKQIEHTIQRVEQCLDEVKNTQEYATKDEYLRAAEAELYESLNTADRDSTTGVVTGRDKTILGTLFLRVAREWEQINTETAISRYSEYYLGINPDSKYMPRKITGLQEKINRQVQNHNI